MPEQMAQRAVLVAAGRTWIGTPYHPEGRVKGVGVDCLTFLAGAFIDAGLVPKDMYIPTYARDWHLHQGEERYMNGILQYCVEVPGPPERLPLPGDIVMWRYGRCFAHGALVAEWPLVIHAKSGQRVGHVNVDQCQALLYVGESREHNKIRLRRFFTFKGWV